MAQSDHDHSSDQDQDQSIRLRARELEIVIGHLPPGPRNDLTDVGGVQVGHSTIIRGEGKHVPGTGPVRTGVTVVLPHAGDIWNDRPSAGFFSLNGCGEVCGAQWINESGALEGPIALTNTHSVGDVSRALTEWMLNKYPRIGLQDDAYLPVIGECDDSQLNDLHGFHVGKEHVMHAINEAQQGGSVAEGAVGAGTGMTCYGFKGGIGSASRIVSIGTDNYSVGVLVNSNHGQTHQLVIDGNPVGRMLSAEHSNKNKEGSIVIILATDAPMNQRQLERLAKRACLGLGRTGSSAANGSGDFVIAFSTTRMIPRNVSTPIISLPEIHSDYINAFFEASIEATEEAILNSLFKATTTSGRDGNKSEQVPIEECLDLMGKSRRQLSG